jgi:hypothetical protein
MLSLGIIIILILLVIGAVIMGVMQDKKKK